MSHELESAEMKKVRKLITFPVRVIAAVFIAAGSFGEFLWDCQERFIYPMETSDADD